ncbi:MAG: hypothetical protein M0030_04530 [Actinomycetota bacterium]|nr:hypothetical protein [Actinomycetota bacterium]
MPSQPAWFRGRGWAGEYSATDHVARQASADHQAWVYRVTQIETEFAALDREAEYERARQEYVETGSETAFARMLEFVTS